jgi:hypothetical protein
MVPRANRQRYLWKLPSFSIFQMEKEGSGEDEVYPDVIEAGWLTQT